MEFDKFVEDFFYYGLLTWIAVVFYLLFGRGIVSLSLVELPHPYGAIITLPDWIVVSVLFSFFALAVVSNHSQKREENFTLGMVICVFGIWTWQLIDLISSPTVSNISKFIFYTGTLFLFIYRFADVWRNR